MRFHLAIIVYCLCFFLAGCGPVQEGSRAQKNTAAKLGPETGEEEVTSSTTDASQEEGINTAHRLTDRLSAREELQSYLDVFEDETNWTYNERKPGELKGQWRTVDRNDSMLEFNINGVEGTFSNDFNGNRAIGVYAVSETGRVVCYSSWNDIGLRTHFKLERGLLIGSRGPSPRVQWRRTDPVPSMLKIE